MDKTYRFWPFRRQTAFLASLVLVPLCVAGAVWLTRSGDHAESSLSGWILLAAVLTGLIPVVLLVLSRVGSVEAAGVKVAFDAVQEVVLATKDTEPRVRLAENLGQPGGVAVADTAGDTIISSLREVLVDDVVVVDLKEGQAWWETRLFLLVSGAVRLGYPKAIAFTAAVPNRPRSFVGWARSSELLRRHMAMNPKMHDAYAQAQRDVLLWQLSTEDASYPGGPRMPWVAAGRAVSYLSSGSKLPPMSEAGASENQAVFPWPSPDPPYPPPVPQHDRFLAERLLLLRLGPLEASERRLLTKQRVEELFSPVLHTDSVDRDEAEGRWLATIVGTVGDYFAVTAGGQFSNLVPRRAAVNAVLLTLVSGPPSEARRNRHA